MGWHAGRQADRQTYIHMVYLDENTFEYLFYGYTTIIIYFNCFRAGTVFGPRILTSEDCPRSKRVNHEICNVVDASFPQQRTSLVSP